MLIGNIRVEEEDLVLCDDLLRLRAADTKQVLLLYFPKSERGTVDYEEITGRHRSIRGSCSQILHEMRITVRW